MDLNNLINITNFFLIFVGIQTDESSMRPIMKGAYQLVRTNTLDTTTFVGGVPRATKSSSDGPFSSPMKDDVKEDPTYDPNSPFSSDDEKCEHEDANLNEQEMYE